MIKDIKIFILIYMVLCSSVQTSGQKSNLIVNDIGGLFAENHYGFDGGLDHFKLIILKEKTNIKKRKIKIKGQVFEKYHNEPIIMFDIFKAKKNESERKIEIFDTLYTVAFGTTMDTIKVYKKGNRIINGIFKINTILGKQDLIYIHIIGYSMLEIRFKDER